MRKILIIDDEQTLRNSIKTFLDASGYQAQSAANSTEGLRILKDFNPEMLLLDLHLTEGLTGIDMLKEIKKVKPDVKVVVLTGFGDDDDVEGECYKAGACLFLCKPLTLFQIKEALDKIG